MDFILNIHTATETAIINISSGQKVLSTLINTDSKQHATFLHTAIHQLLLKNEVRINDLKAIAVTSGPGSYTGIRVGLATAKGLCFSLKIPLITLNTLEAMAFAATENIKDKKAFYCPMIDARRLEVFTAMYNYDLKEIMPPSAVILTESSFSEFTDNPKIYFFGNGSEKFKDLVDKSSFVFINQEITSDAISHLSNEKYQNKDFTPLIYSEPLYIKDFHTANKN